MKMQFKFGHSSYGYNSITIGCNIFINGLPINSSADNLELEEKYGGGCHKKWLTGVCEINKGDAVSFVPYKIDNGVQSEKPETFIFDDSGKNLKGFPYMGEYCGYLKSYTG